MMKFIIYRIYNNFNNMSYVGQTTESLEERWSRHIGYQLNDGTYLHNSMRKYGPENFNIEILGYAKDQDSLDELEYQEILKIPNTLRYNTKIKKGKSGGDTLSGHPNIKEISKKISQSKIGSLNPNSTKIKAINIDINKSFEYDSMKECQKDLNIPRHDIISRRCRGIIKKPYMNKWIFEYVE